MRIEVVADSNVRTDLERDYRRCERRDQLLAAVLERSEARYITDNLKHFPQLELAPPGSGNSYNDEVRRLGTVYQARPETELLKHRSESRSREGWMVLHESVRDIVARQKGTRLSKEAFAKQRRNTPAISRGFEKAVRRD
ncbi:hypothetical protein [Paracoccus isoporae]|uniref:hypothetical protein n=1 Tax=Paracoccus isoporae TaxID=591205 RepID=UPI00115FF5B2|nr:hypothetical protein [Paracoccus isoporae]